MLHRQPEGIAIPFAAPSHGWEVAAPHQSPGPKGLKGHLYQRRYVLERERLAERHRPRAHFSKPRHFHEDVGIFGQRQDSPVSIVRRLRILSAAPEVFDDDVKVGQLLDDVLELRRRELIYSGPLSAYHYPQFSGLPPDSQGVA